MRNDMPPAEVVDDSVKDLWGVFMFKKCWTSSLRKVSSNVEVDFGLVSKLLKGLQTSERFRSYDWFRYTTIFRWKLFTDERFYDMPAGKCTA